MKNKTYPHFCAYCQRQIGENDRAFWFADGPDSTLKPFCSMECISEYYDIGFLEVEDAIWYNEDNKEEDDPETDEYDLWWEEEKEKSE